MLDHNISDIIFVTKTKNKDDHFDHAFSINVLKYFKSFSLTLLLARTQQFPISIGK